MTEDPAASEQSRRDQNAGVPLVVDLDETLIATDTLLEGAVILLKRHPFSIARVLGWLAMGKQRLKARVAEAPTLPSGDLRVMRSW